jgi:hypothetical protein
MLGKHVMRKGAQKIELSEHQAKWQLLFGISVVEPLHYIMIAGNYLVS